MSFETMLKDAKHPRYLNFTKTKKWTLEMGVVAFLFTLTGLAADAQTNYAIDWSSVNSGVSTSTNAVYTVTGTLGQPNVGHSVGGDYALEGGFWVAYAIQTPGAPLLTITAINGLVTVSWPNLAADWVLDMRETFQGAWSQVPAAQYQTNVTDIFVTTNAYFGNVFYRLRQP